MAPTSFLPGPIQYLSLTTVHKREDAKAANANLLIFPTLRQNVGSSMKENDGRVTMAAVVCREQDNHCLHSPSYNIYISGEVRESFLSSTLISLASQKTRAKPPIPLQFYATNAQLLSQFLTCRSAPDPFSVHRVALARGLLMHSRPDLSERRTR